MRPRSSSAFLTLCALLGSSCLTEDTWTENAPESGRACTEVNARVCSANSVLLCNGEFWTTSVTCRSGESCLEGECRCPGGSCCGNGTCEASRDEDCHSCPVDCGTCCTSGTTKCEKTTLKTCSANQVWTSASCNSLCKNAGYTVVTSCEFAPSLGKDSCFCAHDGKIGDPCSSSSDCNLGTCNGSWCQKTCQSFKDCGTNSLGYTNWCISSKGGTMQCFPSCYGATCEARFSGTTCQNATESGVAIKVCAAAP